jgi:heterogeneous nuclear rnp K-like protein
MGADAELANVTDNLARTGLGVDAADERVGPDGEAAPRTEEEYAQSQLTLRAIVSSKEAGVIIGKAGKNVADLREETGVKAGVSKVLQGVHERVLTVTGPLEGLSKAYSIVCRCLLEGAPQMGMGGIVTNNGTHRKSEAGPRPCPGHSCGFAYPTRFRTAADAPKCSHPPTDIT